MKNSMCTLRTAITVVMLFTALTHSFAALQPSILIKVGQDQKLVVEIKQLHEKVELSLLGANQETVYAEEVNNLQQAYFKTFNLSNLESGQYTLVVRTGTREVRQPFSLQENQVALDTKKRHELFLPQIKVSQESVELNLLNRQISTVRVAILNLEGELVYEDIIPNIINVERRYNLEKLEHGMYTLTVHTPERIFYQEFKH